MIIPLKELQDAVVTSLRSIAELTEQLGGADYITAYDPEAGELRNAIEAQRAMEEGSLLVIFEGLGEALRGEIPRWQYQFTIAMFCPGDFTAAAGNNPGYFDVARSIIDGIVPATGMRWLDSPVHDSFDPPDDVRMNRSQIDGAETWQVTFSLIEIGG